MLCPAGERADCGRRRSEAQQMSQSTWYCLRKYHHCTLWNILGGKDPATWGIKLEIVIFESCDVTNLCRSSGIQVLLKSGFRHSDSHQWLRSAIGDFTAKNLALKISNLQGNVILNWEPVSSIVPIRGARVV